MIVKKPVCVCARCGDAWLPQRTDKNPKADPRLVERCGRCKSSRWNDDDPSVQAKKSAPKPMTDHQKQNAQQTLERSRKVTRENKAFRRAAEKEAKGSGERPAPALQFCRHRIFKANCPICRSTK